MLTAQREVQTDDIVDRSYELLRDAEAEFFSTRPLGRARSSPQRRRPFRDSLDRTPRKGRTISDNVETAVLAGGCYWIMQQLLRHRDGIISTRVGWTGGENDNPTEEDNSGHVEAVKVTFDPKRLSFRDLLEFFFLVHRSDLDERIVGSGYRSEIFYTSDETKISEAGPFWEAEARDQDYFQRYPDGCTPPFPRAGVEAATRETATSSV